MKQRDVNYQDEIVTQIGRDLEYQSLGCDFEAKRKQKMFVCIRQGKCSILYRLYSFYNVKKINQNFNKAHQGQNVERQKVNMFRSGGARVVQFFKTKLTRSKTHNELQEPA